MAVTVAADVSRPRRVMPWPRVTVPRSDPKELEEAGAAAVSGGRHGEGWASPPREKRQGRANRSARN